MFSKKCLVLFVFVLLLMTITGCASSIRGFSTYDGKPLDSTTQSTEQEKREYLTILKEKALDHVSVSTLDIETMTMAKEVFVKLKNLDAVTDMGVNYEDYPIYVRNACFEIDRFVTHCGKQHRHLSLAFRLCLVPYVKAQHHFNEIIQSQPRTLYRDEHRFYLKACWNVGKEAIAMVGKQLQLQ